MKSGNKSCNIAQQNAKAQNNAGGCKICKSIQKVQNNAKGTQHDAKEGKRIKEDNIIQNHTKEPQNHASK